MVHRILIVDDEEDIRAVAAMALDANPELDVRTCQSGAEGREIAEWWQPHLILLDVRMPGLSGPETLSELRSSGRTATIPVIFFTAGVQKQELDGLRELGAQGVIAKPFDPMTLAVQICQYLPDLGIQSDVDLADALADPDPRDTGQMKSLLYVSRSCLREAETDIEVRKIIAKARTRNECLGITGALIFTPTHFAQYFEGPCSAVDELFEKVKGDPRHKDVRIVCTAPYTGRYFSDWSMAYGGSSVFVSNLVKTALEDQRAASAPAKLIRLMREFTNDRKGAA